MFVQYHAPISAEYKDFQIFQTNMAGWLYFHAVSHGLSYGELRAPREKWGKIASPKHAFEA